MAMPIATITFIALGALAAPMPRGAHPAPPPPVPTFDCSGVIPPNEAGSFASANPAALRDFYAAARESGFDGGTARIELAFDATGTVVSASVSKSSGNRAADQAALNWAFCTKVKPGKESSTILPVMFRW